MKNYATCWSGPGFAKAMALEGFPLPEGCGDVLAEFPVDGVIQLHFIRILTEEELAGFGRALTRMGENNFEGVKQTSRERELNEMMHETRKEKANDQA